MTEKTTIKVINAYFCKPRNGMAGLYITLQYNQGKSTDAYRKATELAHAFGFDNFGRCEIGLPSHYGIGNYNRNYWFFDIDGKYCGSPEFSSTLENAKLGSLCVYEYAQFDPRKPK